MNDNRLTICVMNTTEKSPPWENDSCSACQGTPRLLW